MKISFALLLLAIPLLLFSAELSLDGMNFAPVSKSDIGFAVYDIQDNEELFALNTDRNFSYASNLKLLTTATSLHHLGGGFRFLTMFKFEKNTGTLFVKGAGDPAIDLSEMNRIVTALKMRGVAGVRKVVVDDYLYGPKGRHSVVPGENGDHGYLAYISPLAYNGNQVLITVKALTPGKPVKVEIDHPGGYFVLKNRAVSTADGENRLIIGTKRSGDRTEIVVRGTLGAYRKKPIQISKKVYTPSVNFVRTLLYLMGEKNTAPVERRELPLPFMEMTQKNLYIHKGRPLRDVVKVMNRYSSNFIADSLQFFMGVILSGDYRKGVKILEDYAADQIGEPVEIINGSGLGNGKNLMKPRFFMKLLKHMASNPFFAFDFFASLPVMGEDGTLRTADADSSGGMIRAKTGSLTSVAALSGIMKGKSGKLYLFTFTVNRFPSKSFRRMWRFRDRFMDYVWQRL